MSQIVVSPSEIIVINFGVQLRFSFSKGDTLFSHIGFLIREHTSEPYFDEIKKSIKFLFVI